jgi:hypothetical protein
MKIADFRDTTPFLYSMLWRREAVYTSETSVDNYFTRQYIPEDKSERRSTSRTLHSAFPTSLSSSLFICFTQLPDDGCSTHLWNVGLLQRNYTALWPRRLIPVSTSYCVTSGSVPDPDVSAANSVCRCIYVFNKDCIFVNFFNQDFFSSCISFLCSLVFYCFLFQRLTVIGFSAAVKDMNKLTIFNWLPASSSPRASRFYALCDSLPCKPLQIPHSSAMPVMRVSAFSIIYGRHLP